MAQTDTRQTSVVKIMTTRDFTRGAQDGAAAAPWPKDKIVSWHYERGRLFGAMHPNVPIKVGRAVNRLAVKLIALAIADRSIL